MFIVEQVYCFMDNQNHQLFFKFFFVNNIILLIKCFLTVFSYFGILSVYYILIIDENSGSLILKVLLRKYFQNVLINKNIHFIQDDFLNICAIINRFRPQICSTNDDDKIDLYKKMLITSQKENPFIDRCQQFSKRILNKNKRLDPNSLIFPVLTEEYIESLTFGVYQLKQARSYTFEHLDENGNYLFEINEQEDNQYEKIIHVKLHSRFQSQKIHDAWIEYNPDLR